MMMTRPVIDLWIGTVDHIMNVIQTNIKPDDIHWDLNQIMISVQRSDALSYKKTDYMKAMKRLIAQGKAELKYLNGTVYYIFK